MGEARGEIRIYARCFCLYENSDVRIPPASNSFTNFYFLRNSLGLHIPLPSPRQITSFHRLRRRCRLTVTLNGGRFTSGRSERNGERAVREDDHETKISRVVPKESVCVSIGSRGGEGGGRQGPPPEEPPSVARLSDLRRVRLGSWLETSVESRS